MSRLVHFVSILAAGLAPAVFLSPAAGAEPSAAPAADPAPAAGSAALPLEPVVPGGLTADQVAERAVRTSPGLRADQEDAVAQAYAVERARAAFLPRISGALRYARTSRESSPSLGNLVVAPPEAAAGPVDGNTPLFVAPIAFPTIVNHYEAQATLDVPLSDYALRLPQLYDAAKKNARAAELLLAANRLQEASEARVVYYDWVRARLQRRVAEAALERSRVHLTDARTALQLGTASRADVLSVEAQVANAELVLARARAAAAVMERRLSVLLHDPAPAEYQLGEDLNAPHPVARPEPAAEPQLLQRALARRLEPRVLSENAGAERQRASATLASELPRLVGTGALYYSRPSQRVMPPVDEFRGSWEVGVALSWSPTELLGNEASRQATLAKARQLDAQREELQDRIALELESALTSLEQAEVAVHTSDRALAAASEAHRVRRELFQNGRATSAELTDAETEWSQAQLDAVAARADVRVAQVKLAHALGDDVPDGI